MGSHSVACHPAEVTFPPSPRRIILYRKDRATLNDKKRRGVALYVRNTLHSVGYDELNFKKCEGIWCKIYRNKVDDFVVGVCY